MSPLRLVRKSTNCENLERANVLGPYMDTLDCNQSNPAQFHVQTLLFAVSAFACISKEKSNPVFLVNLALHHVVSMLESQQVVPVVCILWLHVPALAYY